MQQPRSGAVQYCEPRGEYRPEEAVIVPRNHVGSDGLVALVSHTCATGAQHGCAERGTASGKRRTARGLACMHATNGRGGEAEGGGWGHVPGIACFCAPGAQTRPSRRRPRGMSRPSGTRTAARTACKCRSWSGRHPRRTACASHPTRTRTWPAAGREEGARGGGGEGLVRTTACQQTPTRAPHSTTPQGNSSTTPPQNGSECPRAYTPCTRSRPGSRGALAARRGNDRRARTPTGKGLGMTDAGTSSSSCFTPPFWKAT
jgi:hypothetical protein